MQRGMSLAMVAARGFHHDQVGPCGSTELLNLLKAGGIVPDPDLVSRRMNSGIKPSLADVDSHGCPTTMSRNG